mgnify:CR=1 FL=1
MGLSQRLPGSRNQFRQMGLEWRKRTVLYQLEELQVSLGQHGIYIQAVEEIAITPDVSEVDADLSRIADNGDYWSPGMYLDVNEDRIEVNQYDNC